MRVQLSTIISILFLNCPSFSQTVSHIEQKFGKPIAVYSVSEHIWMTPEYATDGQVCRISLYPKHVSGSAGESFSFQSSAKDYVAPSENSTPSVDDFLRSETSKTEIVIIQWSDRKCPA